jgi:hypothetical protein
VTPASFMYKRLQSLPWVPISASCGFGTQVSLHDSDVLCTIIDLWFWDSASEPFSVTCASVLSRIETFLLTFPHSCNCHLLSVRHTSSLSESPIPPVVGVVRPHSWCWVRVNPGDHRCHSCNILYSSVFHFLCSVLNYSYGYALLVEHSSQNTGSTPQCLDHVIGSISYI